MTCSQKTWAEVQQSWISRERKICVKRWNVAIVFHCQKNVRNKKKLCDIDCSLFSNQILNFSWFFSFILFLIDIFLCVTSHTRHYLSLHLYIYKYIFFNVYSIFINFRFSRPISHCYLFVRRWWWILKIKIYIRVKNI